MLVHIQALILALQPQHDKAGAFSSFGSTLTAPE